MAQRVREPRAPTSVTTIDCDIHHHLTSPDSLAPYLEMPRRSFVLPWPCYVNPRGSARVDSQMPDGSPAASDPRYVASHHLDPFSLRYGVLNVGNALSLGGLAPVPDVATMIARAFNNWTLDEWLSVDDRYLASVLVAPQFPIQAAEEIDRVGRHPRVVQIYMSVAAALLGNEFFFPIYEVAEDLNLPIGIHVGGEGAGVNGPPTRVGWPGSHIEFHSMLTASGQVQIASLLTSRVFRRFPKLRFVFYEYGVAWVPYLLWRSDRAWKDLRNQAPWLEERPSHYLAQHIRFGTQPLEEPHVPQHLIDLLGTFDGHLLLLLTSDYPHWDFDNPKVVFRHFPAEWRAAIMHGNAERLYCLPDA